MMQEKVSFFYSQKKIGNKLIDSWEFARWSELGLTIIQNFITEGEEKEIVSHINPDDTPKHRGRRKILRYGSDAPYQNYVVSSELPHYLDKIAQKLVDEKLVLEKSNHASLNIYDIADTIPPHIDSLTSGKVITILSLLSDAEMLFEKGEDKFFIPLPRRSLIQMQGKIRWEYNHSIPKIKNQRYSIVFRNSKS